jgi:uncharacterized protein YndB with AHSA1/START domain
MPHLINTIEINATPDTVWTVLGDLAATRDWLPGTVDSRVDGTTRVCVMAGGEEVQEQISDYSAEHRTYRWRHLRVPLPVRHSSGRYTVTPGEHGGAVVTLETEFTPLGTDAATELASMIDAAFQQSLQALRRWIEQGRRWDAA